jgi:glycosyltransferase involved in cell wall biosynthesis
MAEVRRDGASILAVIVLYKMRPENSTAYQTLTTAISRLGTQPRAVAILLYDNMPHAPVPQDLPPDVLYVPAARNEGVAGAYNYALRWATREGFAWMLTLDQDTQLPPEFLLRMRAIALRLKDVNEVGAIVPHLLSRGRLLSPVRIRPWGVTYLRRHTAGFATGEIHAFNSASLFRVRALEQIDGWTTRMPISTPSCTSAGGRFTSRKISKWSTICHCFRRRGPWRESVSGIFLRRSRLTATYIEGESVDFSSPDGCSAASGANSEMGSILQLDA